MKSLSTRCNDVLGRTWTRQCQGRYSYDIKLKYGNRLVEPDDPYVIHYMPPDKYLITMGKSKLDNAETVILSAKGFLDENNNIIEKLKYLGCVPYRFRFTEELVAHCKGRDRPDRLQGGYAHFTVLNYAVHDFNRKQEWISGWFLLVSIYSSLKK
ncbi:uncharacterized protein LOC111069947 [Drosophila obscura]|uniref:uncharacterized protein LOC111069947 n=1 Tax=Drosophila obscura TaxID=7282 RepID=UPI001BB127F7|nr:uncharacterized protein LOC111069947 [Drosophila obscura]